METFQSLLLVSQLAEASLGGYTLNTTVSLPHDRNPWDLQDVPLVVETLCH